MKHLAVVERASLVLAAVVMAGALSAIALFTAAQHFATLHTYTLVGDSFELATRQVEEITSDVEVMSSEIIREVPAEPWGGRRLTLSDWEG